MKKYIIFFILTFSTLISCQSFLEETPEDFLGGDNFYKNEADASIGLNGIFGQLQSQTYYQRTVWSVLELTGDYLQSALVNAPRQELEQYTYTSTNAEINNWWVSSYSLINRANDLIEKVPAIKFQDEAKKNNIMGNARFLRALAYFDLVRSFGEVPLILETIKGPNDNMKPSRSPIAEVYQQIIEDLEFAEKNCFEEKAIPAGEKGRVSSGAATSLLAKVYLTRASTPAAEAGDNQAALDACNRVIALNTYALQEYTSIFSPDKENWSNATPEHIFEVQFDLPPHIGNIIIQMQYPTNGESLPGKAGAGSFKVNPKFVESYAVEDIRKSWNIGQVNSAGNYFFYKYRDPQRQGNNSRVNFIVLRFADVLLMRSEALNNINPADEAKLTDINKVRERAGLTGAMQLKMEDVASKEAFANAIAMERAWELCLEGHRRFDLLRLGLLKEYQQKFYSRTIEDNYLLFPIPSTETTLNPNLLPNNPGF
jgi:starch-binding outer membrane protein, SusD/RagB family